ncbi:23083_t:CDS:2, partial [Gigaspora margarita]
YTDEKQIEPEIQVWQYLFIIGLGDNSSLNTSIYEQSFSDLLLNSSNIFFNDVYTKINYYKSYITVSGLSKKATQTSLNAKKTISKKNETISSCSSNNNFVAVEDLIVFTKRGLQEESN